MDVPIKAVRNGTRAVALLDGKAHANVVRSIHSKQLTALCRSLPFPLRLFKAEPTDSWGDADASYFVIDTIRFLERCKKGVGTHVIIDVSAGLTTPMVIPDTNTAYDALAASIALAFDNVSRSDSAAENSIPELIAKGMLDSVLLGWLLDYPCVYYSSTTGRNCLGDEPLLLISLYEPNEPAPFTSFSLPILLKKEPSVAGSLETARKRWEDRNITWKQEVVSMTSFSL